MDELLEQGRAHWRRENRKKGAERLVDLNVVGQREVENVDECKKYLAKRQSFGASYD